ncbi:MAG: hypothetical protein JNM55_19475 [Anaerolineales bacterium]|nr:hypothetical protein [Anaerolineales bacterium]
MPFIFFKKYFSPVKYISSVNIIITGIGAVVGIINARLLGPEALGVIAVVLGIYSSITTFIDVRLIDVVGKLYYQMEEAQYRGNVLRVYLIFSGLLGGLMWLCNYFIVVFAAGYFTDTLIKPGWVAYSAFYFSLNYLVSAFQYQQRFSERFYLIGTWRFLIYLGWVFIFLLILASSPNVEGYFSASFWGVVWNFIMTVFLSVFIWIKYEHFNIFSNDFGGVFRVYFQQVRLIFWGNLLGYTKMLHRGADILLVSYFADDRVTGLYKIARSLADSTFVFYDSMNQVYFPRFMQLLSANSFQEYRKLILRSLSAAGFLTLVIIVGEWVGLKYFVKYVLTSKFAGAELAILILSSTLFFIVGFYIWLWPILIHNGKLGYFTGFSIVAGFIQYLITVMLLQFSAADPASAALGYLGYYLFLIPVMWYLAGRLKPELFHGLLKMGIFKR